MTRDTRLEFWARLAVTVGAILPYLPLLSLQHIYITDDGFTSDIYNGELPIRVLMGRLVAAGEWPVWSSQLCSGLPLMPGDPLSLGLFATLPAAPALCLTVLGYVLLAAHGTYALARRIGAGRSGACLAGMAFAASGFFVTQLKHLGVIGTVAWFPLALLLLERALGAAEASLPARLRDVGLFGVVFAMQVLAGFPQSAYYGGIVYAAWALVLLVRAGGEPIGRGLRVRLAIALAIAAALAGLSGAVVLMPLSELGSVSDRQGRLPWEFASMLPYGWKNALNFVLPYVNGDVADGTYKEQGLFWENYGYVGIATCLLAAFAVVRGIRRPRVGLLLATGVLAFLMVLGKNTPFYYWVWRYFPGMSSFRFPTRYLFVVDLVLCLLGGLGLTLLEPLLNRVLRKSAPRMVGVLAPVIVFATALDLFANQTHQNPFVPASDWLAPPAVVTAMKGVEGDSRLFSPGHNFFHRFAFRVARGWSELGPYRELRETVAPNLGAYWGVATADCYSGISPSWVVDVWGDHSRDGFVASALVKRHREALVGAPWLVNVFGAYGVTHLATPLPLNAPGLSRVAEVEQTHVYRLAGKRARIVASAEYVASGREAASRMLQMDYDPDAVLFLQSTSRGATRRSVSLPAVASGDARVVDESSRHVRVQVNAPRGGYLLLADTYYPGWQAVVDGKRVTIERANLSMRAVELPPNAREVLFSYEPTPFWRGLWLSLGGLTALLAWVIGASVVLVRRGAPLTMKAG